VPGVDLIAALSRCAPLLQSYGGHAGAAGFAIEADRIPELRVALSRAVAQVAKAIPEITLTIDAYVELPDLDLELVSELNRLAPFGPGNPPPTLAVRDLRLLSETTIGRTTVEDAQGQTQTVLWWQGAGLPLPRGRFDLALSARTSDFRGVTSVQVEWLDAREQEPLAVPIRAAPAITICDYRGLSNPRSALNELLAGGGVQIWAEAEAASRLPARNRLDLEPGPRLAIWTLPPGPRELQGRCRLAPGSYRLPWSAYSPRKWFSLPTTRAQTIYRPLPGVWRGSSSMPSGPREGGCLSKRPPP